MAERTRSLRSLDEESQAGIISFVHRLPGEIPLTGRAEEPAEASTSAAAATTPKSGNKRSLYLLFHASARVRTYIRAVERSRILRSAQGAHPQSSRVLRRHCDVCHREMQEVNYDLAVYDMSPVFSSTTCKSTTYCTIWKYNLVHYVYEENTWYHNISIILRDNFSSIDWNRPSKLQRNSTQNWYVSYSSYCFYHTR